VGLPAPPGSPLTESRPGARTAALSAATRAPAAYRPRPADALLQQPRRVGVTQVVGPDVPDAGGFHRGVPHPVRPSCCSAAACPPRGQGEGAGAAARRVGHPAVPFALAPRTCRPARASTARPARPLPLRVRLHPVRGLVVGLHDPHHRRVARRGVRRAARSLTPPHPGVNEDVGDQLVPTVGSCAHTARTRRGSGTAPAPAPPDQLQPGGRVRRHHLGIDRGVHRRREQVHDPLHRLRAHPALAEVATHSGRRGG
jgi:hypothetical protein